ncbi:unnamed protein product [Rhizophagus irregularis]|nr:unnamed protein product [Rhizophagus irregularis]
MMEDIEFLTTHCKFGATIQRKFLEEKYPSHPIYSNDLYAAIQKFRPTSKTLSNDAALMSNWLDIQKEKNSRWVIARGWDDDNVLTRLFWMTPEQVENWIQFSDCVLNDVTHKTNRYGMALSLFVGFNRHRHNILLAQSLLFDESLSSHAWMFSEILKATNREPVVIITDADPAVDAAVRQIFSHTYPIHCAFHITQNLHKNLRKTLKNDYQKFLEAFYICRNSLASEIFESRFINLCHNFPAAKEYLEILYNTKTYWAHCYISFKFTGGMIASSRVESVNACLKRLIYSSNTSLCDLMTEIHRLLDMQDQREQYTFWKLAIPYIKNQDKANFLFQQVDKYLEKFFTPIILQRQRDEINQAVYYVATVIQDDDQKKLIEVSIYSVIKTRVKKWFRNFSSNDPTEIHDISAVEIAQTTLKQVISLVGLCNLLQIWAITVGNSTTVKHYVVLLKNNSHICTCLFTIQQGIVCRHYFQVMLATSDAKFHIRLILSRWYFKDLDGTKEPFISADKFYKENMEQDEPTIHINYLSAFDQDNHDFLEESLPIIQQKMIYGELHGMYKKALQKALQSKTKSQQLKELLQNFNEDINEQSEQSDNDESDKENHVVALQNPIKRCGKGRPLGTKRFKSFHENKNKEK